MTSSHESHDISSGTAVEKEDSKHLHTWSSRWDDSRIGWHIKDVHTFLLKYGETILSNHTSTSNTPMNKKRVLVPLCGKTVDLAFLAKHNAVEEVVGVEGIEKAISEFIEDNPDLDISSDPTNIGAFDKYSGNSIVLLKGDFFHVCDDELYTDGRFDMIWDRGAMVAIDPKDRETYVKTLGTLLKPGGSILVTTVDRTDTNTEAPGAGPPYSINELDIRTIYKGCDWVDTITLEEKGAVDDERLLYELCFRICAKSV